MNNSIFKVVFLAGATDFHAMDWVKSCLKANPNKKVRVITDLLNSQGFSSVNHTNLIVTKLVLINKLLFKNESYFGHKWRNILKLLVLPLQAFLLHRISKTKSINIIHAHSMYYLVLARMARVKYIGTPVGSDVLLKPFKSKFFFYFAKYGIKKAEYITVDSQAMVDILISKFDYQGTIDIIQNGIDIDTISKNNIQEFTKFDSSFIYSNRGIAPIYQQEYLLQTRNKSNPELPIFFSYPFIEIDYAVKIKELFSSNDIDLGKISKIEMYEKMRHSLIVVSIPHSDSSPRSVYEAIFCGAIVVINKAKYFEDLPTCMKDRIIVADLNNSNWLTEACSKASMLKRNKFKPSQDAILKFDQFNSYKTLEKIYEKFNL
jgi:glycosyltransferase involved in cell wall biosynthesis